MTVADNQGFPQLQSPIANPQTGLITQPWYQLIIALWNRTGAGQNVVAQGVYSGKVDIFAGPVGQIPQGWLPCDGRAVSRATYKALFTAIGTTWGNGDGSTTFNLPPPDRMFIGAGGLYAVGATGGAATEVLTVGNLPAHNHGVTDPQHTHTFTGTAHTHAITDAGHVHTDGTPNATADVAAGAAKTSAIAGTTGNSTTGIVIQSTTAGGTNAASSTGIATQNTGSGTAINILPPYAAMTFIIKT